MQLRKMATVDVPKRRNAELLIERTASGEFQLVSGDTVSGSGWVRIDGVEFDLGVYGCSEVATRLRDYCTEKGNKLEFLTSAGWVKLTDIHKDNIFSAQKKRQSGVDGRLGQERQERSLVEIINQCAPVFIPPIGVVQRAEKYEGLSALGKEPYTDIILISDKKAFNISCKDETAPSLGGGGLVGLKETVPDFVDTFFDTVKFDMGEDGLVQGVSRHFKEVPDYFYRITSDDHLRKIFIGNELMGGPVHFMYIGPMDVTFTEGRFNGRFIPIEEYYRKTEFYLRLRKRDIHASGMVDIDFETTNKQGFPAIFLSGGRIASRILIDKKTYGNKVRNL